MPQHNFKLKTDVKKKKPQATIAKPKKDRRTAAERVRDIYVNKMTKAINKKNEAVIAGKYVGSGGHFQVFEAGKIPEQFHKKLLKNKK